MMQLGRFLVFVFLLVDVCALKGTSVARSRGLKEEKEQNENDAKKEMKTEDEKIPKKGEMEELKGKKSSGAKEGKKCKKSPINKEDEEDDEDDGEGDDLGDDSDLEDEEEYNSSLDDDLLVCASFDVNADCPMLLAGQSPSIPDSADGVAGGILKLEVTSKAENATEEMSQSLQNIALKVVGCDESDWARKLQADETNTTEAVELNGIKIVEMSTGDIDCSVVGGNCTLETPFTIYFSGNITLNELKSMAYSLSDTVLSESDDGDYDGFADVHYVEATLNEGSLDGYIVEAPKTASEGPNVGGIVGGTVGGLAVLGGGVAGYMYHRSRKGASVNPSNK